MKKILSLLSVIALLISSLAVVTMADDTTESTEPELVVSSNGRLPFEDIDAESWYIEGLTFCYTNGIISGAGNTYTFNPKGELTRATFAVMLARAIGADLSVTTWNTFADCDYSETSWYAKAVEWAALNGYMNGTGDGNFSPNVTMTREQLATVFMRFMMNVGYEVEVNDEVLADYTDTADVSEWALEGVKYAVAAGLISSTSTTDKVASPKMSVTREQAVKLFTSFLRTYFYGSCEHKLSDVTCTEASVCSECGMVDKMANGHLCEALTCKDASVCTVCGAEVEADSGLHIYAPENCTTAETCTICGTTRRGALGHYFTVATCVVPSTCLRCGIVTGEVTGHNFVNAKCTICNFDAFRVTANKLIEVESITSKTSSGNDSLEYVLWYDAERDEICITLFHYFSHGDSDFVMFSINNKNQIYQFDYEYYLNDEDIYFDGMGKFDPTTFSSSANISFSEYKGNVSDIPTALANVKILGNKMLEMTAILIPQYIPEVQITMFGFVNYPV